MILTKPVVVHHFTVDVEEYFQVSAFEPWVLRSNWDSLESRVAESTIRLADVLNARGIRGTFFVLGWVAEREPGLIKELANSGHEIASHGWDHCRVTNQTPDEFRYSVRRTKHFLEDLVGVPVSGFRAPSFSIVPGREWALDILIEEGYAYDSSLFPIRRPGYGYTRGGRDPHWLTRSGGRLLEIPPATLRRFGMNIPAGGGAYLRLFPYKLVQSALLESALRGVPGTFYIHPWEMDPDQPRIATSWTTRFRHYGGLNRTADRVTALLDEFSFQPIADTAFAMANS